MEYTIFYNSLDSTGQSQLAKAIAKLRYPTATVVDTAGEDESGLDTLIAAIDDGSQTEIIITNDLVDSHAESKFTTEQAVDLIAKLVTANQTGSTGANVTGTAQANSTLTNIKLAAADTGANDAYNNMIIATTGDVEVFRLITDYVASTKIATVATTGSAVDASEDYTIYTTDHLHLVGHTYDSEKACKRAWDEFYSNQTQVPVIVSMMNDASTLFEKTDLTATGSGTNYIEDTSEFTADAYANGEYYLAITSATTGAGQIRKITANTVTKVTVETAFDITLSGTIKYQIVHRNIFVLWNKYLPYAISTYLNLNDSETNRIWAKILDQYEDIEGQSLSTNKKYWQDLETLNEYIQKGKAIFDYAAQYI